MKKFYKIGLSFSFITIVSLIFIGKLWRVFKMKHSIYSRLIGYYAVIPLIVVLVSPAVFAQWESQSSGTNETLRSVHFTDVNNGYAVGGNGTVLKTTNGGGNWGVQNPGVNSYLFSIYFINADTGFAVGDNTTFLKTTDGGNDWYYSSGPFNTFSSVYFINSDTGYIAGYNWNSDNGVILKTTDGGSNWNIAFNTGISEFLNSIQFIDADTGYAVGGRCGAFTTSVVVKTTDGGNNWFSINPQASASSVYFTDANTGYIVGADPFSCDAIILKTTNGGDNWISQNPGTTEYIISVWFATAETGYIVGGNGTVLKTTNGGGNWGVQNPGVNSNLFSIYFINADTGFAVGENGTILKTTNGGGAIVGIEDISQSDIPQRIFLAQNYPNPFNPRTKIKFSIPESDIVQIKVYDILGKEITIIVNEYKQVGSYEAEFDASNLPSGVYFYRMISGSYSETKKMILLR